MNVLFLADTLLKCDLGKGYKREGRDLSTRKKERGGEIRQKIKAVRRFLKLGSWGRPHGHRGTHGETMCPRGMPVRMEPRQAVESWHGPKSQVPGTAKTARRCTKENLGDRLTLV